MWEFFITFILLRQFSFDNVIVLCRAVLYCVAFFCNLGKPPFMITATIFYCFCILIFLFGCTCLYFKIDDYRLEKKEKEDGEWVMIIEYTDDETFCNMRCERRKGYTGEKVVWQKVASPEMK